MNIPVFRNSIFGRPLTSGLRPSAFIFGPSRQIVTNGRNGGLGSGLTPACGLTPAARADARTSGLRPSKGVVFKSIHIFYPQRPLRQIVTNGRNGGLGSGLTPACGLTPAARADARASGLRPSTRGVLIGGIPHSSGLRPSPRFTF